MGCILLVGEPGVGKVILLLKIMRHFKNVVWVTTVRSAKEVRKIVKRDDMWVVDAYTGLKVKSHPRDIVVEDPLNLSKISVSIDLVLDEVNDKCLLIFDSISGIVLYHPIQKVIQFLRSILVKIEDEYPGIFTLIKNAHDEHTELLIYSLFQNILEFSRKHHGKETLRFVKIVRSSEFLEPELSEFKIVKDDVVLPPHVESYILKLLDVNSSNLK
jgi:KaiC/GvpD/RAD55 family RecA-like ATPase